MLIRMPHRSLDVFNMVFKTVPPIDLVAETEALATCNAIQANISPFPLFVALFALSLLGP
jgi:hypothetical protein